MSSNAPHAVLPNAPDADEAEYILAQEEHELQELIASMEEQQEYAPMEQEETVSQHYGSDDEDYDSIFMECASATEFLQPPHDQTSQFGVNLNDVDEMDMS